MHESGTNPPPNRPNANLLNRQPGSLQEAIFIAGLRTERPYRALLELGVQSDQLAPLSRRATGTPDDALCCDLYKFVFGYHAVREDAYRMRRQRLQSAAR